MRYEAAATSVIVAATATPIVAIRVPATERCAIRQIGVTLQGATSTRLALARASAVSVAPTGTPFRRITLPAAVGAGYQWDWQQGEELIVGLGSAIAELCIVNLVAAAPALFDWWVKWED
jgi:hypothetical protein